MAADRRIDAAGDVRAGPRSVARTAPRPCRAGAGIRSRRCRRRSSRMVATVSALWVANCGKMRGRSASSCLRAGDVVQVGHRLAGEHRIVVEAALLRALDLGVPIGALDQAHHHAPVERCARARRHSRSRRWRASDRPGSRARSRPSRASDGSANAAAITSSDSSSRSASSASTVKLRS